mgnify:CR=1 FL=1
MTIRARRRHSSNLLLCLFLLLICGTEVVRGEPTADGPQITPWFTGTLLSTRGISLGKGHAVVEPYLYYTRYGGLYNDNWRLQSATTSQSLTQQTYFIYGLTDSLDIEIAPQWIGNHARGDSSGGFGDLPLNLGVQAWRSPAQSWVPDIRLWVQEIFPTGRYSDLSPATPQTRQPLAVLVPKTQRNRTRSVVVKCLASRVRRTVRSLGFLRS